MGSAIRAAAGVQVKSRNKHFLFWSYFSALFISFVAMVAVDFISAAFYLVEFFLTFFNHENLVDFFEIENSNEFVKEFEVLTGTERSLPSMIMFLITAKGLLLLTLNFAIIYSLFITSWKICRDNQKVILKIQKPKKIKPQPSPVMSVKSIASYDTLPKQKTQNSSTNTLEIYKSRNNNDVSNNNNTYIVEEEIEMPELTIPRVSYERSSDAEYPSSHVVYQSSPPPSYNNKRNNKTHF
jgi:hypothetical protein